MRRWIVTAAAGLVLADASIVTLALPELLRELDTSVEGVAAVIAVYTLVLALALLPAERLTRRHGPALVGAAGFALFGVASALCAVSDTLALLLVARAIQALGGAAGLIAAFELIEGGTSAGRRHWLAAAVLSAAIGPALGGALTQAFDWRAIFIVQVPLAAVACGSALLSRRDWPEHAPAPTNADRAGGVSAAEPGSLRAGSASITTGPARQPGSGQAGGGAGNAQDRAAASAPATTASFAGPHVSRPIPILPAAALALLSAALTAVLFLLVLLLVAGWAITPLAAAATVSILPLAAIAGDRIGGPPRMRAAAGSLLVGAGVLALAWLPDADVWWTFVPQILAGVGMGMALPAFAGELLPEETPRDAAWLLTIRHGGIALVLIAVAPLIANQLETTTERAKERGVALVLDARLPPQDKISLAPELLSGVDADQPRAGLEEALDAHRGDYGGEEGEVYDALARRADETVVTAVGEAFRGAFVIAGAAAILAALALLAWRPKPQVASRPGPAPAGADRAGGASAADPGSLRAGSASIATGPARQRGRALTAGGHSGRALGAGGHPGRALAAGGHPGRALAITAAILVIATPAVYAAAHREIAPEPVALQDPCEDRDLPDTGGITGFLQDTALEAIDAGACRLHVSREELVLALADESEAKRFEQRHGVDPRSVTSLLEGLLNP